MPSFRYDCNCPTTCYPCQTLHVAWQGGTGNCYVYLWIPDGEKGTNHLRINRKAARPGAGIQGPQITLKTQHFKFLCS